MSIIDINFLDWGHKFGSNVKIWVKKRSKFGNSVWNSIFIIESCFKHQNICLEMHCQISYNHFLIWAILLELCYKTFNWDQTVSAQNIQLVSTMTQDQIIWFEWTSVEQRYMVILLTLLILNFLRLPFFIEIFKFCSLLKKHFFHNFKARIIKLGICRLDVTSINNWY